MSNKRDAPDQTVVFLSATVGPTARVLPAGRAARSSAHLTPAQGSTDTRVCGPIFMAIGGHSQAEVQLRIRNPMTYIESLQVK